MDAARDFGEIKHKGQLRKYNGRPYFTHCEGVHNLVMKYGGTSIQGDVAYLHDTLEDTDTTVKELVDCFGKRIAILVVELTNVYTKENYPSLNRRERKILEHNRLSGISDEAALIKACDRLHNLMDMEGAEKGFQLLYLDESFELFNILKPKLPTELKTDFRKELSYLATMLGA